MAGATSPDGLIYPTSGDPGSPRTQITTAMNSVQSALDKRMIYSFRWATTDLMDDQIGMSYGDLGYNEQTNTTMVYDNITNAWIPFGGVDQPGLRLIVPTSVSGAGVAIANGGVSFGAANSISVNGVFSSKYARYKIVGTGLPSADSGAAFFFRTGTTNDTSANYRFGMNHSNSGTPVSSNSNASAPMAIVTGTRFYFDMDLYDVAIAIPTAMTYQVALATASGAVNHSISVVHAVATAYDGFTITGTGWTGSLKVYGYA